MLSKIKPVPRFILIVAVLGAIAYGVSKSGVLDKLNPPAQEAATQPDPAVQPQPAGVRAVTPEPEPTPVAQPEPQAASPSNAGLDAVLKQGAKK